MRKRFISAARVGTYTIPTALIVTMESNGNVDFVGPMFLWISPIEAKVEGKRKNRPKLTLPVNNNVSTATAAPSPVASSSLLKAKTALQRRFIGGNSSDLLFKRGTYFYYEAVHALILPSYYTAVHAVSDAWCDGVVFLQLTRLLMLAFG